ncbi:MAG TPA: hypothetical protein VF011_00835 [Terriglobales bacterium]
MANSPTLEGLGRVYRQPSLALAEVTWRWSFAVAAWLLFVFAVLEFLDSLPVTTGDLFLLHTRIPSLVLITVRHLLMAGTRRGIAVFIIVVCAAVLLWMLAASAGRTAILRVLLNRSQMPPALDTSDRADADSAPKLLHLCCPLLGVHFLRAGLLLATLLAWAAAAIWAGVGSSGRSSQPLAFLLFLGLIFIIAVLWSLLDRLLSIAPIFAIREGRDTFGSIGAAMEFVHSHRRRVAGVSTVFALLHVVIFFAASSLASVPLTLASILPLWIVAASLLLLTLVYFVVVDALYVARLASYIRIIDMPDESDRSSIIKWQPPAPAVGSGAAGEDDILSDIPGLIPPPETA